MRAKPLFIMHVKKIEIRNFKAVEEANIDLNGAHIMIMGKNGIGKTTIGKLVQDLLTKNQPSKPLKEGERQGFCRIELSDGSIIHYAFDEVGQKLNIVSNDTTDLSAAQLFKKLSGKGLEFDIDKFLGMSPKPRRDMLMQISGIDLTDIDKRYEAAYKARSEANTRLKTQQSRIKPYDEELVDKEKIEIAKASQKYAEAIAHNQTYSQKKSKLETIQVEADEISKKIIELQQKLANLNVERMEVSEWLNNNVEFKENALAEMQKEIAESETINQKIDEARRLAEEYKLCERYEKESDQAHALVLSIESEKESKLKTANLPSGVKFTDDGLEIDGLPFESNQIATSRKMIAALEIAEKMLGDVRYLHFDASVLDKDNAMKIIEWANEKDLQLCLERAMWDGGELTYEIIEK